MADLVQFSGMLQNTTSTFLRRPDQLIRAVNVHGDNVGILTRRLGYSEYGTTSDSDQVYGMQSYNYIEGGTQTLFRFVGGKLQHQTAGTWTNSTTGLTSDANAEFRVFIDELFMVGANSSNTFLTTANIDDTSYSTNNNVSGAPKGKFVELYKDQLYIANVEVSGTRYSDRFYRSSLPDTAGTAITWTSTDFERVYTANGEEIMGMHTNKVLNRLLLFKKTSMHSWDTFRLTDVANIGTTSHRSIQTVNYTTFFFNEAGIYAYQGGQPQLISRGIQKWIDAISDPTAVHAVAKDNKFYKLYIGDVTVDGEDYTNCEIRYSVPDNTFAIYSYKDTFSIYAPHTVSNETRIYGGTSDGECHQFAHRDDEVYADDGVAIASEFMFETDMGIPSERKAIDQAIIYSTQAQNLTGRIRVKNKDWSSHFSVDKDEHEINVNPDDGRILQWHFSEASVQAPFKFEGLTFSPHLTTRKYT